MQLSFQLILCAAGERLSLGGQVSLHVESGQCTVLRLSATSFNSMLRAKSLSTFLWFRFLILSNVDSIHLVFFYLSLMRFVSDGC